MRPFFEVVASDFTIETGNNRFALMRSFQCCVEITARFQVSLHYNIVLRVATIFLRTAGLCLVKLELVELREAQSNKMFLVQVLAPYSFLSTKVYLVEKISVSLNLCFITHCKTFVKSCGGLERSKKYSVLNCLKITAPIVPPL